MINPFRNFLGDIIYGNWAGYDMLVEIEMVSMFAFEIRMFDIDKEKDIKNEVFSTMASGFYSQVIEACDDLTSERQSIGPNLEIVYIEKQKNHNTNITFPI